MHLTKWFGVRGVTSAAAIAFVAIGCGSNSGLDSSDETGGTAKEGQDSQQVGLRLGDSGPAVARLFERLNAIGYFPNDTLRATYTDWIPVVPKAPAVADAFDETLEAGLKAYQARSGLAPTGVLDEATAVALDAPGCGFPESGARDENWKFDVDSVNSWGKFNLTWRLTSGLFGATTGLTDTSFDNAVNAAFNEWAAHSPFTFTRIMTGTADIDIDFRATLNQSDWDAQAIPTASGGVISKYSLSFKNSLNWTGGLRAMTLHELGHALSLSHTTVTTCTAGVPCAAGPVMRHWVGGTVNLVNDDLISVHARWPGYVNQNRTSRFLTAGGDGSVWSLGPSAVSKGYPISKWTPSGGWTNVSGNGADSMGVESNGTAWVTDNTGQVYITSIFGWLPLGSVRVKGIAAGTDQVWALGRISNPSIDAPIYQWSDAAIDFTLVNGLTAISIAVDPTGTAYALKLNGEVYRRTGTTWTNLGWAAPAFANSIKIGANGSIWVVTADSSGFKTYVRNDQAASAPDQAAAQHRWLLVSGPAGTTSTLDITATADGRLWSTTVNSSAPYRLWRSED